MTDDDYRRLLAFRDELRRFLRWSESEARAAGLTPAQHQLLLAIRGHDGGSGHGAAPSIAEVADHLLLKHHSVVELVDRAAAAGLVDRVPDPSDQRVVRLRVTPEGEARLATLSAAHLSELPRLRALLSPVVAAE